MKRFLLLLGTALMALPLIVPSSRAASSASAPPHSAGVRNSGPLYQLNVQVLAAAKAFQQGSDASAEQLLQTPAIPATASPSAAAIELGFRLYLVAQKLAFFHDYVTARHVAGIALNQFAAPSIAAGTGAQMAQVLELCGSLEEHVLNDKQSALTDYKDALKFDPTRAISAFRIKALQALPAGAIQAGN